MRYCVIKDTIKVIDGSDNPIEIMLRNAKNAGFSDNDVEILTDEEYLARKKEEPEPTKEPTQKERILALEQALLEIL